MLNRHHRVQFSAIFMLLLLVFLAFSLWLSAVVLAATDRPGAKIISAQMVRDVFVMASIFLVFSGYLLTSLMAYCLVTYLLSSLARVTVSILLFALAFLFFSYMIGSDISGLTFARMLLGMASVAISDRLAESFIRRIDEP